VAPDAAHVDLYRHCDPGSLHACLVSTPNFSLILYSVKANKNNCSNGILLDSRKNMHDMIVAIIKDNQGNVIEKGFNNDDFIDTYEQSCEVMMANE